jgi:hypothetical protein
MLRHSRWGRFGFRLSFVAYWWSTVVKHVQSAGWLALLMAVLLAAHFAVVNVAPAVEQIAADDPIVYITATGKRYHRASCGHLKKSKKAVRLSTLPRNYTPCGDCKPPI